MPQHDLDIANASGASVRADLNSALAALGSAMKGPNAPPAPLAGMIWVDDDTPSATVWTVKQYDGADWIDLGRLDITANAYTPSEGVVAWASVASAATVNLGAQASRHLLITGTTTITSFDTVASGLRRELRFAGALTLTHSVNLLLPGGVNIPTAAGDTATAISLGSGIWVVTNYEFSSQAAARGAIGATATGGALFTAADAAAARSTIVAPPLPTASGGVGNFTSISSGVGAAAVLPAGGTWAYFIIRISSTGTVDFWNASIGAGGGTIGGVSGSAQWLGFCWRIS